MKKHVYILFWILVPCVILIACGGDSDSGYSYSFIDQNVTGKVNNKAWTYAGGTAKEDFFENTKMSVDLTATTLEDPCNDFTSGLRVFFSVSPTVGIYELNLDINSADESFTVTLYDPDDGNLNIIATMGAVEILSISDTEVTGRMDVFYDSETNVNGNFSIPYCTGG